MKIQKNSESLLINEMNEYGRGGNYFQEGIRLAEMFQVEDFEETCDLYIFDNGELYIIKRLTKNEGNKLSYKIKNNGTYELNSIKKRSKEEIEKILNQLTNINKIEEAINILTENQSNDK